MRRGAARLCPRERERAICIEFRPLKSASLISVRTSDAYKNVPRAYDKRLTRSFIRTGITDQRGATRRDATRGFNSSGWRGGASANARTIGGATRRREFRPLFVNIFLRLNFNPTRRIGLSEISLVCSAATELDLNRFTLRCQIRLLPGAQLELIFSVP